MWERKIYGPLKIGDIWRIRTNTELKDLYKDLDIVTDIKKRRLIWVGHLERMGEDRGCRKIYRGKTEGRRKTGRPRKRWVDGVEEDLKKMGVRGWRRKALERKEWKEIVGKAKVLQGL